jgi:hypothetical protein
LLSRFQGRAADARDFALRARVLLLQHSNGVPLDIALGALPFEAHSIEQLGVACGRGRETSHVQR